VGGWFLWFGFVLVCVLVVQVAACSAVKTGWRGECGGRLLLLARSFNCRQPWSRSSLVCSAIGAHPDCLVTFTPNCLFFQAFNYLS